MNHSTTTRSNETDTGGYAGLTEQGCRTAVSQYCEVEGDREGVGAQRQSLRAMLAALVRKDGPVEPNQLEDYYQPAKQDVPDRGHYGGHRFPQFYQEAAEPELLKIPGVEQAGNGLRFAGVETKEIEVDASETRPLDTIRSDPRTHAQNEIAELVGFHSERYEALLGPWEYVAQSGRITDEQLRQVQRYELTEQRASVLASLPAIERREESPPSPEEIETYADVLEAREATQHGPGRRVVWGYVDDGYDA